MVCNIKYCEYYIVLIYVYVYAYICVNIELVFVYQSIVHYDG